jgi:hypothetical protein
MTIVENFFPLGGMRWHELGLYFEIELPPQVPSEGEFPSSEAHLPLVMRWFALDALPNIHPWCLRDELHDPPASTRHVVHRD